MKRSMLYSIMVLGAVVSLMSTAGIFAVFTDRATTGTNTITSGARPSSADLKVASTSQSFTDCQTFSDDLTTDLFTAAGVQPGDAVGSKAICVENAGAASLALSTTVIDLIDVEDGCTGDEEAAGDATCGSGQGELASVLWIDVTPLDCATGSGPSSTSKTLSSSSSSSSSLGSLAPGARTCVFFRVRYPSNIPDASSQMAQSDSVTWRFAFDGATS